MNCMIVENGARCIRDGQISICRHHYDMLIELSTRKEKEIYSEMGKRSKRNLTSEEAKEMARKSWSPNRRSRMGRKKKEDNTGAQNLL